ncbi:hypothetical protein F0562_023434 [Nyssa sinensis]|uniref:Uncharacterized protein n=1 Tax=Nyssa sinensis TaxID=561372 RepID=A0A5J5BJJ2_9ASTE|nr:hypothetical protein F0562_023434 [Nyssa sinensis]
MLGNSQPKMAPAQEARCCIVHSEVVDSELAEVLVGPERAMGVADFEPVAAAGLVMAVVGSVRLKLADFELNSSEFGSDSQFAEPWYLSFDQLCLDEADA